MPGKVLLDTDVFSAIRKGRDPIVAGRAAAYLAAHGRLTVSAVSVMEVVRGLRRAGGGSLARFTARLAAIEVLDFDRPAAELAGQIAGDLQRLGRPIGAADPMIAAIALQHGRPLATGNARHFGYVVAAGFPLVLEDWRTP